MPIARLKWVGVNPISVTVSRCFFSTLRQMSSTFLSGNCCLAFFDFRISLTGNAAKGVFLLRCHWTSPMSASISTQNMKPAARKMHSVVVIPGFSHLLLLSPPSFPAFVKGMRLTYEILRLFLLVLAQTWFQFEQGYVPSRYSFLTQQKMLCAYSPSFIIYLLSQPLCFQWISDNRKAGKYPASLCNGNPILLWRLFLMLPQSNWRWCNIFGSSSVDLWYTPLWNFLL